MTERGRAWAVAVLSAVVLAAAPAPSRAGEPELPPCRALAAVPGHRTLSLVVVRGSGVPEREAQRLAGLAASYWRQRGLELRVDGPVGVVEDEPLIVGRAREVEVELSRAGAADRELTDEERTRAAARVALAPLRRFLERHATPARDAVQIVVLTRVVQPGSVLTGALTDVQGLTFSPRLRGGLGGLLGIERFTPTVLLSVEELRGAYREDAALTPAHEVGHALGLEHEADPANLMATSRTRGCQPVVDARQLERVFGSAVVGARAR